MIKTSVMFPVLQVKVHVFANDEHMYMRSRLGGGFNPSER